MRILLAGTGKLGVCLATPLLNSRHTIIGILQNGRQAKGLKRLFYSTVLGHFGGGDSILRFAKKNHIPVYWIDKMDNADLQPLKDISPDLILTGGFGIIYKKNLLKLPNIGCVNVHSSLLPRHRGPNPFYAVVRQGDPITGVTFHIMDEGIDTGPIIEQKSFPVTDTDTAYSIYCKASELAGEMVVDVINRIEQEGLHGEPQNPENATYDPKPTLNDAIIQWDVPAIEIDRQIRALSQTIVPRFSHNNKNVYVTRVRVNKKEVPVPPGTVIYPRFPAEIATAEGSITLLTAFTLKPIMLPWPRKNIIREGERLESNKN
ncbi:MAG TPA: methionyl-tRNA formyltransferase [Candidatus Hydrogenedens sp.]|nr:methionyl-tRNA formyltransferase [Candidatus Hydrogenedens sp.]HOL20277.1 methionyl-tRNA formyltransferase [Candidatus Hydrogenedens sp.]HPP58129.1 methionyl-tRNA formyltransferase [Candidatus Hydrogenedens sp.]